MLSYKVKELKKDDLKQSIARMNFPIEGQVVDVVGSVIEAYLPMARLGALCRIKVDENRLALAEVVGFRSKKVLLLPYSSLSGISPGAPIIGRSMLDTAKVSTDLLGCVVDPFLEPLMGTFEASKVPFEEVIVDKDPPNPMLRSRIVQPLSLGIKAIDGLLTFGEGQRIGIMAGSGVGKSVLMGMIAKYSDSDVNVIGLIGERGREVREFIENDLGEEGLKRSVVVVVTSDQSPLMRLRAAKLVTAIGEYFSGKGKKVLLMMDSLTRVAQAQREIGLAVGEPPTSKGYPPSVYAVLPRLLERCGPQPLGRGSISGIYTVLVDGDDFNDPIPDAARAILDGHINLSRSLAASNHYPAIEVHTSVSRVMKEIVDVHHLDLAGKMKSLIALYQENIDLIQLGSYARGSNLDLDLAIELMPQIRAFLAQGMHERSDIHKSIQKMQSILMRQES